MPVTIYPTSLKYKNQNNEFQSATAIKGDDYILTAQDKADIAELAASDLIDDTAGVGDEDVTWSADKIAGELANAETVDLSNYVQNTDYASASTAGIVKVNAEFGTAMRSTPNQNTIMTVKANLSTIKIGSHSYVVITPNNQHQAVFYGLAKAAGDTTQSASSNAVGNYTAVAKASIKNMLGIQADLQVIEVSGASPTLSCIANARYVCGEVTSLSITPPTMGTCEIRFTSGSTPTVLTLPNTVKMPEWFTVEANRVYSINIEDGIYGVVASWPV